VLSPAYDINPNPAGPAGLTLNIDDADNSLNIDLAMSVAPYFFRTILDNCQGIINDICSVIRWQHPHRADAHTP